MSRSMRRDRFSLGAVLACFLVLAGCARPTDDARAPAPRLAARRVCPGLDVGIVPAGFRLRDQRLPNLGDGVLGRVTEYGDGERTVAFHMGDDPLDALEDLDFESETVESAGRSYALSTTKLSPGLFVATWTAPGARPPCDEVAAVARGLRLDELTRVLDGIR